MYIDPLSNNALPTMTAGHPSPLTLAVGELVNAAAHRWGLVGPMPFMILRDGRNAAAGEEEMKKNEKYTAAQERFIDELVAAYGIDRSDVTFFPNDPKPFLGYAAQCALVNVLGDVFEIDSALEPSPHSDSIAMKVRLTFRDGRSRSAIGVANENEPDADGKPMTRQQLIYTAVSRAMRNALRAAGLDLVKLHQEAGEAHAWCGTGTPRNTGIPMVDNYENLLRQVHALGAEAGLIVGQDKTLWRAFLISRYERSHSNNLSEEQLADLAAALKQFKRAA